MDGSTAPDRPSWRPSPDLLDRLTVAAVAVDHAGRVTYCNESALTFFGLERGDLLGARLSEVLADESERGGLDEVAARVAGGVPWAGDLTLRCAGGRRREVATSWSPLSEEEGVVTGMLLLAETVRPEEAEEAEELGEAGELGESGQAEEAGRAGAVERRGNGTAHAQLLHRRLSRLATVTTDLLASRTTEDVARVVTDQMTDAAGATVGSMSLLLDAETLALVGIRGGSEGVAARWSTYAVAGGTPAGDAVRTRRPVVLRSRAEIEAAYPDLERAAAGERAIVCLPLLAGDRDLGVVSLSFPGSRSIDEAELLFLRLLADVCAHAIDRIRAQQAAADREAKLAFLADASARLATDLDYESTLVAVAEAAVPWFADWCAIALEDDGRLRTLSVAHADRASVPLVEELQVRYPAEPDEGRGAYKVLATGESEWVPDVSDELLEQVAVDEEHLRLLRALGFRSGMSCPLKVHDRVLGVVSWVTGASGRRYDADDLKFGEDLARRAAAAIDNAELHSQLRDVALRLQHAVLPDRLPSPPGWEAAVVYSPAGRTDAGGDFYDVVDLGEGRLALFVGDVMGRGVEAASVMAQMRSAIRTIVALDPDPAAVMARLDQVFDRLALEHLVTVAYAVADRERGTVELINAGHPAPLLLRRDGSVEVVSHTQTMLLGAGGGERSLVSRPFDVGDELLLYTDGLVERRGEDTDVGLHRLVSAARELARPDLAGFLTGLVETVRDPTRDDDVAALALRRTA